MRKIVCLATSPWYPIPTRKQQVMSRIPDAEILYFDPSITYIAPMKDKAAQPGLTNYKKAGVHPQENITVYALPPVLPFFYKFRWINKLNQQKIARFVREKMREHGFEGAVLWVYSPVTADLVDLVPHKALVYDCVDRHSAYGGLMDPALVDAMELELAKKADHVFATADALADRLRTVQPKTDMIPNGANFERFVQAAQPQPLPDDMQGIPHPIFGFVGALQSCIEYGYLEAAAKARPDWSFVLIPLKFYEYLATGRPIVSTKQPDQILQYAPLIEIADSQEEFISACEKSCSDTAPEQIDARIEAGRACSWDSRVAQMCGILEGHGIL